MSAEKVFNADISIHAPTRGATKCGKIRGCTMGFQSTLPRGERLCESSYGERDIQISIHAPTRGATYGKGLQRSTTRLFQSTLPRGERPLVRSTSVSPILISIHAPTRGATITTRINKNSGEISIHAPTRGATQHPLQTIQHSQYFNPRSHEGSDEITKAERKYNINFNPRSHEGSD